MRFQILPACEKPVFIMTHNHADYKQILTPSVVSDNQVSRRRGIILHERTVCVYGKTKLLHHLNWTGKKFSQIAMV